MEGLLEPGRDLVAYFCAEYGVHESLPLYSGGLGVLAGDHLKTASDMGLPLVAVGLFYREGYFTQTLGADGRQQVHYAAVTPEEFSAWAEATSASDSGPVLDEAAYRKLLTQTQNLKPYTYRAVARDLFGDIVSQKLPPGEGPPTGPINTAVSAQQEN